MRAIAPINTEIEYNAALQRIEELIVSNPKEGIFEYNELDTFGALISEYEDIHYPIA